MTNNQIIFAQRLELMKQGVIGTTGRQLETMYDEGNKKMLNEPEMIHTYAGWQKQGFQVKKGQKAIACFPIWKHTISKSKDAKDGEEDSEAKENMYMTKAYWFKADQVEKIQPKVAAVAVGA